MNVYLLHQRQRVERWDGGGWDDEVKLLGIFSSQEAAIRWLRRSRQVWGDKTALVPLSHPSGYTLSDGRYTVTVHTVDPEPITKQEWAARRGAMAIVGDDGEIIIQMPPQAQKEHE